MTVEEMVRNLPKMSYCAMVEKNGKMSQNPHPDPDQYQKLIITRWSPFAHIMLGQRPFPRS